MNRCIALLVALCLLTAGCDRHPVQSVSGIEMKTSGKVKTDKDGLTVEQRNIRRRIQADNQPGSIKHLYVISAYSGQVILYSTVDGKVTSSKKRLTPSSIGPGDANYLPRINIGGVLYSTNEVLGEDGAFGESIPYLYWWDAQGRYQQHYVAGAEILHISDQPIGVKSIIINIEDTAPPKVAPTAEKVANE